MFRGFGGLGFTESSNNLQFSLLYTLIMGTKPTMVEAVGLQVETGQGSFLIKDHVFSLVASGLPYII